MKKEINFKNECSVIIIGHTAEGKEVRFTYERLNILTDEELTKEAMVNFEDMKKRKLMNVDNLMSIYIARNVEQYRKIVKDVAMT